MEYLHGGDIYSDGKIRLDFSVNTSPLGMPESIRQAVINSSGSWERYPDSRSRSLKSALADYYGGRIPKDAFICGNGSADLMYTLIFALRPERALVPVPAFAEYQMALGAGGCLAKPILLEESAGFSLEKNKEKLMEHIRKSSGIDMMMLGNPVNPCGSAAGREWIEEMAGLCREKEIFLVIDECFNWFLKERQHFSAIPLITEEPEKYRHGNQCVYENLCNGRATVWICGLYRQGSYKADGTVPSALERFGPGGGGRDGCSHGEGRGGEDGGTGGNGTLFSYGKSCRTRVYRLSVHGQLSSIQGRYGL